MNTILKIVIGGVFLLMLIISAIALPSIVSAQYAGYSYHSYQMCSGSGLYWYDSYGNQQDLAQFCSGGCYNNSCSYNNYNDYNNYNNYNDYNNYNNYNNYSNCTYHAYKLCVGNNVYWYSGGGSGCNIQQDLYANCNGGQTCQYGACTSYVQPVPVQPQNNYSAYSKTACYNNSIYWYDSVGVASGLYKSCADSNSCTADTCSAGKCVNTTKCDGSTCAIGSNDYNSYCATTPAPVPNANHCGNGNCESVLGETIANCPGDCRVTAPAVGLSVALFTKQTSGDDQWQKTAKIGSDGKIYFMISVTNSSVTQIDNVNVSANIPNEISSLGNLQINGVATAGDIISGINIGSVAPSTSKIVTFEGRTQTVSGNGTKQATAKSNVSGAEQTDSVSINLDSTQINAGLSNAPATFGFLEFLKNWYLWILGAVVLVFLFIIVFRRISSES